MASQRIVSCLSGGVDSTVAAALLLEPGHEVIGTVAKAGHEVTGLDNYMFEGCTFDLLEAIHAFGGAFCQRLRVVVASDMLGEFLDERGVFFHFSPPIR